MWCKNLSKCDIWAIPLKVSVPSACYCLLQDANCFWLLRKGSGDLIHLSMSIFCRILLIEKYWEPIAQKSFGQDWKWDWKLENVRVKPHVVVAATGSSLTCSKNLFYWNVSASQCKKVLSVLEDPNNLLSWCCSSPLKAFDGHKRGWGK